MPKMGDLAAQDNYGDVDWSRMNQPFGELLDPNPKLYDTKAGPIYQADINQAIDVGLGVSGGGLATKGIKAYHSSPHDFDKFDLSKIGSGEGAQMYGHGLYFAENPAVSGLGGNYWSAFLERFPQQEKFAADAMRYAKGDHAKALATSQEGIDTVLKNMKLATPDEVKNYLEPALQNRLATHELLKSRGPTGQIGPRTYEVNINADPAHMLDWDKPLRRQSPEVVEGLQKAMNPRQWKEFNVSDASTAMRQGFIGSDMRTASKKIAEAGIPGIKYLDQASRGPQIVANLGGRPVPPPSQTSNYVIFDPNIIDIMKKYGIAGAAPAAMGALAAQDNYQPQERM